MKRAILTTLLVVCPAMPVLAANLEFSAGAEGEYDDNVFRAEEDKDDDFLIRLRPAVRIYEDHGDDLNFSVGYEAPIEFSVDHSDDLDDVDHIGSGSFQYHVNDRTQIIGGDTFGYLRSTLRHSDVNAQATAPGTLEFNDKRDRVKTNDGNLGVIHHFSPRTIGRFVASSTFFDSTRDDRARVWTASAFADAQYKLTMKHQLGGGAGYAYQDYDDREDISGSHTNSYRVFGSWRWTITETLSFDLTAGPAYLETEQDDSDRVRIEPAIPNIPLNDGTGRVLVPDFTTCGLQDNTPVASKCQFKLILSEADASALLGPKVRMLNSNPSGERDDEFTGFAEVTLSQRWSPTLVSALRYSRQQGNASGVGGTAIEDVLALSNTWDFAERWQLAVRGDYVRRESAFELAQTFDEVVGCQIAPAGDFIATRDLDATTICNTGVGTVGRSFNSNRDVEIDTDTWGVAGRVTHQLFKTTSIYVQARYSEQESRQNSLGADSDFENFLATFGVRHVFEPIPLW